MPDPTNPNPAPAASSAPSNPNPAPTPAPAQDSSQPAAKPYTQEQLNAMMAAEKRTARQALLKELGFTVGDDQSYKDTMAGIKQTLDASKTQAQKDAEARKQAEENLAAAEAREKQLNMKVSLLAAGIQAAYLDDVITIAASKVSDVNTIDKVIEDLKQRYPMFFTAAPTPPKGTGSGSNPPKKPASGGDPLGKSLAQMNKQVHKSTYFKNT